MPTKRDSSKEYIQTLNPLGYVNNRELTNLDGLYLVKGSKNALIVNNEKVVSAKRYKLVGSAKTVNKGITSKDFWKLNNGSRLTIRGDARGQLDIYSSLLGDWETIMTGLPKNQKYRFTRWWSTAEQLELLLFVDGTDTVHEWSGGIAEIASFTSNTLTKKGYLGASTIAFVDGGASADTITDSSNGFLTAGFAAGDLITVSGTSSNDGSYTIHSVTAGVITLDVDDVLANESAGSAFVIKWTNEGTWALSRFLKNGTRKVTIGGIEYPYTGGEDTGTLTGVSVNPTGNVTAGDLAIQTVRNSNPTAIDGLQVDLISMFHNHVWYGSTVSREYLLSKNTDFTDCGFTDPLRVPGEGWEGTVDAFLVGFAPSDDGMYVTCGDDYWYKVTITMGTESDKAVETIEIKQLKTSTGQAAVSQEAVVYIKNAVSFLSQEPTIDTLGQIENVVGPQTLPLSHPIKNDLEAYDLTDADGLYHQGNLLYMLPSEGVLLIYDVIGQYWQPPYFIPGSCLSLIEYGGNVRVAVHSKTSNETYVLFEGRNDNGSVFKFVAAFGYENYGSRFWKKGFDEIATELYMTESTELTHRVLYDYRGATDIREFVIKGTDEQFRFAPRETSALGANPLGSQPLGSFSNESGDEMEGLSKYRVIDTTTFKDFYERQRVFESESPDCHVEIIATGENVDLSDNIPNEIKR